ncbi:MAG: sigma-70 family RNA polymerase sigma factor [Lachnospiraceae bacterium]|nr:sigma-70 family RNA polymerase sigma factor [Lachnospiraceae bacterium]
MKERETDEVLFERVRKKKDNDALRELLIRYREELCFFLQGIVHNPEDAEDLMLDAYAAASSGTARFDGRSSFKTWLFAIGRNLALKFLRKQRLSVSSLKEEMTSDNGTPETEILKTEQNRMLYEALGSIPEDYRQALHLTYFENMSNDEVAVVLDKNKKQVYNLITRGKQALKEALLKLGYEAGM